MISPKHYLIKSFITSEAKIKPATGGTKEMLLGGGRDGGRGGGGESGV